MSDLYLVTIENAEDGVWFDDPEGFDTEQEAKNYATKKAAKRGYKENVICLYRCSFVESYNFYETVSPAVGKSEA